MLANKGQSKGAALLVVRSAAVLEPASLREVNQYRYNPYILWEPIVSFPKSIIEDKRQSSRGIQCGNLHSLSPFPRPGPDLLPSEYTLPITLLDSSEDPQDNLHRYDTPWLNVTALICRLVQTECGHGFAVLGHSRRFIPCSDGR